MAFAKLLGTDILLKKGEGGKIEETNVRELEGKPVFFYFSASWCPPCRQFTPILAKYYRKMKEMKKEFEVVWVSSDKADRDFEDYFKDMPWVALPLKEKALKKKLSRIVKVQSIPTLAVFDKDAKFIHAKAREAVMKDTEGKEFPWIPKSPIEILRDVPILMHGKEKTVAIPFFEIHKKDAFALYFSAHYCPPCRAFTPKLATIYEKMKAKGKSMDIIYCPMDKEEGQFTEYFDEMPWHALPLHHDAIDKLRESLSVESIPTLVTIKRDGTIVSKQAKMVAEEDPEGDNFPWEASALPVVSTLQPSSAVLEALNNEMCVILFLNGAQNKSTPTLEFNKAAEAFEEKQNKTSTTDKLRFFTVDETDLTPSRLYHSVVATLALAMPNHGEATVLYMNLANEGAKQLLSGNISQQNVFDTAVAFKTQQQEDMK